MDTSMNEILVMWWDDDRLCSRWLAVEPGISSEAACAYGERQARLHGVFEPLTVEHYRGESGVQLGREPLAVREFGSRSWRPL